MNRTDLVFASVAVTGRGYGLDAELTEVVDESDLQGAQVA